MEDNKYIHQFYNGLDHSWEDLFNSLPQFPNGWGKTVFTDITIDLSFYHILWQLIKDCKSDVLEKIAGIVEKMNVYEDRDFHRLTPEELYKALAVIGSNVARVLLSRFECTDGIYNELVNSLSMRKQARFIEALINCNTTSITQITQCIRFLQRQEQLFEYSKKKAFCNNPDDTNVQCIEDLTADYSLQAMELNNHQMQMNFFFNEVLESVPKLIKEIDNKIVHDGTLSGEDNDSFCSYKYFTFFFRYCKLRDDSVLNTRATMSFEYLFKLPAVRGLYDEGIECWKNNSWEEKLLAFESRLQETTTDEGKKAINEIEPPTPQIEKPDKEEVKVVSQKPQQIAQETDEETWRLQKYLRRKAKLDKKTKLQHCTGFKKSIEEAGDAGDRALTKFIQGIADRGYIDDDRITKNSLAYALTGRGGFRKMKIIKVEWHHKDSDTREVPESARVLLYISSNLFDSEKGKTYSQLFDVLNAGPNPCIKDGKDQSSAYYDSVSEDFKMFYNECFGQFIKKFDKNTPNK